VAFAISELSDEGKLEVRAELEERARPFATNGGYEIPGLAINTVAS
jgi:hypothetical protein